MADFIQALDPAKLVLVETALSFISSPFSGPSYNLPIFLFGTYAQENTEATQSLQTFTGLLGASVLFDLYWMFAVEQGIIIKLITIIVFLLKIPTFLAFGTALRARGSGQFGGLGIGEGNLNGPTVWSMPGGFTSGGNDGGYQTVDEESAPQAYKQAPAQPAPPPLTNHSLVNSLASHSAPPAAPGAYQSSGV